MDKSWDTFEFLGRFPIHTYPAPPLTPETTLDACCGIFSPVSTLYRVGEGKLQENFEKDALFHDSLCTNNLSSPQIFTEGRRESVHRLFYEGAQKLEKVMNTLLPWILKLWILSRRLLSRVVAISITIIFLPPMFASLNFYSFPNPPPPLPHFHCFPSTTTITTTINTTYVRHLLLCILLIINMKK